MKCHLADWPSQQVESLAPNHSGTWWRNLWPHLRALKDSGCSWWKHCRVGSRQKQSRVSCQKRGKCGLVKRLKDSWAGAIMFGSAYLGRDDRNDRSVRGRMRWWDDIRKGKPLDNLPRGGQKSQKTPHHSTTGHSPSWLSTQAPGRFPDLENAKVSTVTLSHSQREEQVKMLGTVGDTDAET